MKIGDQVRVSKEVYSCFPIGTKGYIKSKGKMYKDSLSLFPIEQVDCWDIVFPDSDDPEEDWPYAEDELELVE